MNEISSLPSLSDLPTQNPNLQANQQLNRFAKVNEMGQNFGASQVQNPNGDVVPIIRHRLLKGNCSWSAQMFERFIKGVDQKEKISAKETQDLILGRSDNIHEAVVKSQGWCGI